MNPQTIDEVAISLGVHRVTVMRWLRTSIHLPKRIRVSDRKRVFLPEDVNAIRRWRDSVVTEQAA